MIIRIRLGARGARREQQVEMLTCSSGGACGQASARHYNQRGERMATRGERVITEERVQDQLRNVIDPEIGMDLVETETLSIEGVETVNAQLTFEPMWSPEMMSPAAKLFFGR